MRIFVMCQGRQRRLKSLVCRKQLLSLGEETILERTLRLLQGRRNLSANLRGVLAHDLVYVVCWQDMIDAFSGLDAVPLVLEDPGWCVLDGIAQLVSRFSRDRTLILLGDVVYSTAALGSICADQRDLFFAATPNLSRATGEVFALSFAGSENQLIAQLLDRVPCRRVHGIEGVGHLRNLLWLAQKTRGLRASPPNEYAPELVLPVTDWTNDLDTEADLLTLQELSLHAHRDWSWFDDETGAAQ